ncbi:MAG: nitroreductase family protein, partial [Chloroflexota bacterium]
RAELADAALGQEFVAQAPVVLVFCAHAERSSKKYGLRGTDLYCLQDATIACTFAMLAATALDLASVWVGAFRESTVRHIIRAPQQHQPVAILPIGYPAEEASIRPRRELSTLIHRL